MIAESEWHDWLGDVEASLGFAPGFIRDGGSIDFLYDIYLVGHPPKYAAKALMERIKRQPSPVVWRGRPSLWRRILGWFGARLA